MTYCGCCGRRCGVDRLWCSQCEGHVSHRPELPAHERTYFALNGKDCPVQLNLDRLSRTSHTGERDDG